MRWSFVVIGPPGLPLVPSEVHAVDLEDVGEADTVITVEVFRQRSPDDDAQYRLHSES